VRGAEIGSRFLDLASSFLSVLRRSLGGNCPCVLADGVYVERLPAPLQADLSKKAISQLR